MEISAFVVGDLQQTVSAKATLGQLAKEIEAASAQKPGLVVLARAVEQANKVWVDGKHRDDPPAKDLIEGLNAIQRVFELLEQTS